jgi:hypothetical protein
VGSDPYPLTSSSSSQDPTAPHGSFGLGGGCAPPGSSPMLGGSHPNTLPATSPGQ